jgi:hypothetical protein
MLNPLESSLFDRILGLDVIFTGQSKLKQVCFQSLDRIERGQSHVGSFYEKMPYPIL